MSEESYAKIAPGFDIKNIKSPVMTYWQAGRLDSTCKGLTNK